MTNRMLWQWFCSRMEGIGIHHPKGDVMKIAFNGDELMEKESAGWETPGTDFWYGKVDKYYPETGEDGGVYQPGSSGSPLFNEDKRVVGQLAKGDTLCSSERRHWHGAFYRSWDDASNDVNRLAAILDPIGSSSQTINTIRSPNIYISGDDPLCSSGGTYHIHNVPSTVNTITWSVFPENYFTNINGTNSSFTTAWAGSENGTATITATLTSDSSSVDITKEIWVGLPDQPEWDPEELDEVQANVPNVACVSGESDGASSYNWGIDGGYIDEGQGTECITFVPYCTWSLGLNVEGVNACGEGPKIAQRANVICMHPEGTLTVMPNPSDDMVTITVEELSREADSSDVQIQSTQKRSYEYYLYDLNYHLIRQFNTDMQTVQIPTHDLKEGFYILHVVQGEKVYRAKIEVRH